MIWFILLIILFIALIIALSLLVFSFKEDIKATAWADAEIRVRQQADNYNLSINKDNNADKISDIR